MNVPGRQEGAPDEPGSGPGEGGRTVTYVFPIEVIVVGALGDEDLHAIEERIWSRFAEAFDQLW